MHTFRFGEQAALIAMLAAGPACAGIRIQIARGHPIIDGIYVNGHGPYRFMVDTGATLNHLDLAMAQSIGLKPTFRTELTASSGTAIVTGASGIRVTVDTLQADEQTFLFAGLDVVHRVHPDVQGVLGEEFLSRFDYLLDLRGKRIEFGKQELEEAKTRVPFQTITGRPVVPTSLGNLVLDSGASLLTLFGVQAAAVTRELITMTGSVKVGMVASKLIIDGRMFWHGRAVTIPHSAESGATGLLPVSLFKAVYVCNSEQYMVFN
ncbi:MAG TPA: retropepsin-like aspartic protease [Bryobacteraceae bacterium]|nr:retropepsin-like aspartic protease [Bryobacteraceae bacterium]